MKPNRYLLLSVFAPILLVVACAPWPARNARLATGDMATSRGARIVRLADTELGIPYRYGGDTPHGFDCSGLVYYVFRHAGIVVPRTATQQYYAAGRITRHDLQPGDLVFFRTGAPSLMHVGIYVGNGRFIHAPETGGVVRYSKLASRYWKTRYLGAGRFN